MRAGHPGWYSTPMGRLSIELVPRSLASLDADLAVVARRFPSVSTVNIPDLLRFELRSWDACERARQTLPHAIPHVRAMDFELGRLEKLRDLLAERGLSEVLVVQGDPPPDLTHRVYPTKSVEVIRGLRELLPDVRVYAALDPYRSSMRAELEFAEAKLEAGAHGLFTQPFFDLRLMEVWWDLLADTEVFWGITPVTAQGTRRYWETKNNAFFPREFEPTLEWNRDFAARVLRWVRERDSNLYFMPIRTDLAAYLEGIVG